MEYEDYFLSQSKQLSQKGGLKRSLINERELNKRLRDKNIEVEYLMIMDKGPYDFRSSA
jgi:hypothetical protein